MKNPSNLLILSVVCLEIAAFVQNLIKEFGLFVLFEFREVLPSLECIKKD